MGHAAEALAFQRRIKEAAHVQCHVYISQIFTIVSTLQCFEYAIGLMFLVERQAIETTSFWERQHTNGWVAILFSAMRWDLKMKRDKERRLRAAEATTCGAADDEDVDPTL